MQKIEIRHRAHRQHIMAAGNTLNKGVLVIQRDNIAGAQVLHRAFRQLKFAHWFDVQIERQVQIQLFERLAPVARRNFPQLAAHQIQRTFHQIVQRLSSGALSGKFIDQTDQHGHYQKANEEQKIELHKQLFH